MQMSKKNITTCVTWAKMGYLSMDPNEVISKH